MNEHSDELPIETLQEIAKRKMPTEAHSDPEAIKNKIADAKRKHQERRVQANLPQ